MGRGGRWRWRTSKGLERMAADPVPEWSQDRLREPSQPRMPSRPAGTMLTPTCVVLSTEYA